jgi:hypothetical protein
MRPRRARARRPDRPQAMVFGGAHRNSRIPSVTLLGECLSAQKRFAEAEPLLVESYQVLKDVQVPRSPILRNARERLVTLYTDRGKPSEATPYTK